MSGGATGRRDLADEALPLWWDAEDEPVSPHPDGRPWRKACGECAFRTRDPQGLGQRYQRDLRDGPPETHFYCVHHQDGDHERVCASYAAIQRGRRARPAAPPARGGEPETPAPCGADGGRP